MIVDALNIYLNASIKSSAKHFVSCYVVIGKNWNSFF